MIRPILATCLVLFGCSDPAASGAGDDDGIVPDASGSKFVPASVTLVPARPETGEKLAIVGGAKKVKPSGRVAVPPGVASVTSAGPDDAAGVVAVAVDGVSTPIDGAAVPAKETDVSPSTKFVPRSVVNSPPTVLPLRGVTEAIVGGGR